MKTVKEIMVRSPKSCGKNEALSKVIKEMAESKIGTMPVVDKDKKVIGILTDRDIALTIGRTNKHISDLRVHEAMTHEAHTCGPEDDADKVFMIMRTQKVARLPVTDRDGTLKGLISLNTVLRQLHDNRGMNDAEYSERKSVITSLHSAAAQNHMMSPYDYEHWGYNEHWGE
jgi:CBS domain-containing protein